MVYIPYFNNFLVMDFEPCTLLIYGANKNVEI